MSATPTCTHCGQLVRGTAFITRGGVTYWLCHTGLLDEWPDCFRLVTIYRHTIAGCPCIQDGWPVLSVAPMRTLPEL